MANVQEENKTVSERVSEFIASNRKAIFIGFVAVVVIVGLIGVFSYTSAKKLEKSMVAIEKAESAYEDLQLIDADNVDEKRAAAEELEQELKDIMDSNAKNYPDMKAAYLLGLLYYGQDDFKEAADMFAAVVNDYSDSYLAPAAAMNQAVSLERLEDFEGAVDRYQFVVDTYAETSAEASHALFSIGRIYETLDKNDLAVAVYEQLTSEYPSSEWSKLAHSRLILLK